MPSAVPRLPARRAALVRVVSLALVATIVGAACSGGGKHRAAARPKPRPAAPAFALVAGPVNVQSAGRPATVTTPNRLAIVRAAQQYIDDAILAPLKGGRVDNAYAAVFGAAVKVAASGRDRAVLTEAATGVARGHLRVTASPVRIDGLGDPSGRLALVATTFTLRIDATTAAGALTIRRSTELTFAPAHGLWLVTAYRASVQRSIGPVTTSTTAHAGTTGTTT